jgi:hypothetical protein
MCGLVRKKYSTSPTFIIFFVIHTKFVNIYHSSYKYVPNCNVNMLYSDKAESRIKENKLNEWPILWYIVIDQIYVWAWDTIDTLCVLYILPRVCVISTSNNLVTEGTSSVAIVDRLAFKTTMLILLLVLWCFHYFLALWSQLHFTTSRTSSHGTNTTSPLVFTNSCDTYTFIYVMVKG